MSLRMNVGAFSFGGTTSQDGLIALIFKAMVFLIVGCVFAVIYVCVALFKIAEWICVTGYASGKARKEQKVEAATQEKVTAGIDDIKRREGFWA